MARKSKNPLFVSTLLKKLKRIFLFIALFYLTVYLPFAFTVYLPFWYKINCRWHPRCEEIGYERASTGIHELTTFFRHQGNLVSISWTNKEKLHLTQVRDITDKLFFLAIIAFVILLLRLGEFTELRYA